MKALNFDKRLRTRDEDSLPAVLTREEVILLPRAGEFVSVYVPDEIGGANYYKLSSTYSEVKDLSEWVRRRASLYYWKQPRTRRRNLLALGADPNEVHRATRSSKGYWRMSQNEIVRFALNNRWLEEQGVPDLNALAAIVALEKTRSLTAWTERSGVKAIWMVLHNGPQARV